MSVKPEGLLGDIKMLMFCIIQCKLKNLNFNPYIYILYYQSNILNYLPPKELLAIRRIFSLVGMITNTNFSNCPNVFKIGVVWQ